MITVCIAEHVPVFLGGMRAIFADAKDMSIVHCVDRATTEANSIEKVRPDLLIAALDLPPKGGLDLVRTLRGRGVTSKILLYGSWNSASTVEIARRLGVNGMISRKDDPADFLQAARSVANGLHYISRSLRSTLSNGKQDRKIDRTLQHLTGTELQVLTLLSGSRTSKQIAETLCISERTVQKHRQNIGRKLSLRGSNALLSFAVNYAETLQQSPDAITTHLKQRTAVANMRRTLSSSAR